MNLQRPILYIALGALLSILLMVVILLTVTWANADAGMRFVAASDIAIDDAHAVCGPLGGPVRLPVRCATRS